MRYIFVSDIHGCYDKLIEALNKVSFDKEKDTLVNLGDPFDRGPDSKGVLEFLMSCPNRILVWGNHDLRLKELIYEEDYPAIYDFENGVTATMKSFTLIGQQAGLDTQIYLFNYEECYAKTAALLRRYFRECCYAVEFPDLIATHAWLPCKEEKIPDKKIVGKVNTHCTLMENWREIKDKQLWEDTTWCHSFMRWESKAFPEKPLLIGHWHAFRFASAIGERRFDAPSIKALRSNDVVNCDSWSSPDGKLIAIDGCSNWPNGGKVNTYVYETEEKPIIYKF